MDMIMERHCSDGHWWQAKLDRTSSGHVDQVGTMWTGAVTMWSGAGTTRGCCRCWTVLTMSWWQRWWRGCRLQPELRGPDVSEEIMYPWTDDVREKYVAQCRW